MFVTFMTSIKKMQDSGPVSNGPQTSAGPGLERNKRVGVTSPGEVHIFLLEHSGSVSQASVVQIGKLEILVRND